MQIAPKNTENLPPKLVVRKNTSFDFSYSPAIHTAGNPYISHFLNAFSLATPITEGILMRTASRIRNEIGDPALAEELKAFVAQEAMHTKEHIKLNKRLAELGYNVEATTKDIQEWVRKTEAKMSTQDLVAACVAGEHAVYSAASTFLLKSDFMSKTDPEVRRIMLWHSMEEVEHQSTYDQIYDYLYPHDTGKRLRYMRQLGFAGSAVGVWTSRFMIDLIKVDGVPPIWRFWEFLDWAAFRPGILTTMTRELASFALPGFRPWRHAKRDLEKMIAVNEEFARHSLAQFKSK